MTEFDFIDWDDESDPDGNVLHIAANGLSPEEVEDVLYDPLGSEGVTRTTSRPIRFGWTSTGKHIVVAYELARDSGITVLRPVTACEVEPRD